MWLESSCDACFAPVGVQSHEYFVSDKYFDSMQPHFACQICQDQLSLAEGNAEHGIRECLFDYSGHFWGRIFHQPATDTILPRAGEIVNITMRIYDWFETVRLIWFGLEGKVAFQNGRMLAVAELTAGSKPAMICSNDERLCPASACFIAFESNCHTRLSCPDTFAVS